MNSSARSASPEAALVQPSLRTAGRVVWVDVIRVVLMFFVVLEHSAYIGEWKSWNDYTSAARMCVFFAMAGYFMAQNCPPESLFPRAAKAKLMAIAYVPLVLMHINFTTYRVGDVVSLIQKGTWTEWLDFAREILGIGFSPPGPLWFLRDLLLLTLAVGFLTRLRRHGLLYVLMAICLLFGWDTPSYRFEIAHFQVIHPRTIAFFALGVALSHVPLEKIAAWFVRWSLPLAVLCTMDVLVEFQYSRALTPAGIAAYLTLCMVGALWVERLLPKTALLIARLGETVFFVYVLHMLALRFIVHHIYTSGRDPFTLLPPWGWVLVVCSLYLLIHAGGMRLKRISPELFNLLAMRPPKKKSRAFDRPNPGERMPDAGVRAGE